MQVEVLLFAVAREAAQADSIVINVTEGARAGDVLEALGQQIPGIAGLIPSCRLAVDSEYVGAEAAVHPGSEVALIPPVSGG